MNKRIARLACRLLIVLVGLGWSGLGSPAVAADPSPAEEAFARLKTLVGTWHGDEADGATSQAIYSLTGNGTTLVERYSRLDRDDHDMLTVYHLDGDRLMLTHYCIADNQPRMVAELDGEQRDRVRFVFLDATNLATADAGHMHQAVFRFLDADRMSQAWTFRQGGADAYTEEVMFRRLR